ncbi:hypothetical protein KIW84_054731 [Lathyrus oleraceus]|uniref:Uncharacterized protein n=1 Tax=Pisum sativum TaxID=3888 RepID=A0A9D4WWF3_PEA|nr:hypothetical protein KIW84_054731 [Pisum sativum]
MPQKDKATKRATPPKTTGAPEIDLEPESSPIGPGEEVSGEELDGAVPGGDLLDGSVAGESAGVAELEGIPPEEASGGEETDGPSVTVGAATGLLTGATAAVGGGVDGD